MADLDDVVDELQQIKSLLSEWQFIKYPHAFQQNCLKCGRPINAFDLGVITSESGLVVHSDQYHRDIKLILPTAD
jgi:hypothetical protein